MNGEQRILKLLKRRKKGYNIETEMVEGKNYYGEKVKYGMYKLVELNTTG